MPPAWLGAAVLLAPRLWMAGLSCAVDCAVLRLCRASGLEGSARSALLLLGTAWPCLLLLCRPLSNALETALLAAALSANARGWERGSARVYLTLLGGGVFGNEIAWITRAIERACDALRDPTKFGKIVVKP